MFSALFVSISFNFVVGFSVRGLSKVTSDSSPESSDSISAFKTIFFNIRRGEIEDGVTINNI